jgi:RNA polymerase sigma factor (sigma-70 family)
MADTRKMLSEYVKNESEDAFRQLVASYIDLVSSTAARLTGGDMHLAEDVAQTVFIHLARRAPRLPDGVMLGGWLHRDTCNVAAKMMRGERRRQARERQAMEMNMPDHRHTNLAQILPILDEAIDHLGAEDRTAILLRFFEQRNFRAVGEALGSNEDTAQKRVSRALDKLQILLKRRGVTLSAAALGTALTTHSVTAAPAGLAAGIAGLALASTTTSGTTTALLKAIIMTKTQTTILAGLLLTAGLTVGLVSQHQKLRRLHAENDALRVENNGLSERLAASTNLAGATLAADDRERLRRENETLQRGSQDLLRLRGEVSRLRREHTEVQAQLENALGIATKSLQERIMPDLANVASGLAHENNGVYPTNFDEVKAKVAQEILQRRDLTNAAELGLDRFEFVPYGKPLTKDDYGKLLLRERVPRRRATDGKWVRLYTHVGSVTTEASSEDGNFDQFEQQENERRLGQPGRMPEAIAPPDSRP